MPSGQATDVKNAGSLLWGLDAARSDSANKLADSMVSAGSKEVAGSFDLQNAAPQDVANNLRYLFQRNTVRPQNNNANPMLGQSSPLYQREKSDQQITSGLRPDVDASANWNAGTGNANLPPVNYPSGSYYGGGAYHYGGGAYQGVAQNQPVLRSPKEGGSAGGSGGAVVASAPSSPQETVLNEKVLRQVVRRPSPQSAPAFKGIPRDVPVLGDVPVVGGIFQSTPGAAGGSFKANLGPSTPPQSASLGWVESGVVIATNSLAFGMSGPAQAPTTPPSATTISGYADTSAQWNFGTGNAERGHHSART